MTTKWADALARAYEETGQEPPPALVPSLDPDRWPEGWASGAVTDAERAWFDANGYRHIRVQPRVHDDPVQLSDRTPELGWSGSPKGVSRTGERLNVEGFVVYNDGIGTSVRRSGWAIRNWIIGIGSTFEFWYKR